MRWKRRGIVFTLQAVLMIMFTFITCGLILQLGNQTITNYRSDKLRAEADAIDRALEKYSKDHVGLNPSTVKYSETYHKLMYSGRKIYPKDLAELGVIQSDFGYFARAMRVFGITTAVNYEAFHYATQTDGNGIMSYTLGVNLPNGVYYTSPGSSHAFGSGASH